MSHRVSNFKCDDCKISFKAVGEINPGFSDFCDVNCPECKMKLGEMRHDGFGDPSIENITKNNVNVKTFKDGESKDTKSESKKSISTQEEIGKKVKKEIEEFKKLSKEEQQKKSIEMKLKRSKKKATKNIKEKKVESGSDEDDVIENIKNDSIEDTEDDEFQIKDHSHQSGKIILSTSSTNEMNRIQNAGVYNLIKEYIELPLLPVNKEITIDKIGVYNWDSIKRKSRDGIKYQILTLLNPLEYPEGKNPQLDYMPDEFVSPVVIIDINGNKFRTKDLFWFPLIDISDGILIKQARTKKKIFPQKIFIDEDGKNENGMMANKWISILFNLVGHDILEKLRNQS